MSKQDKFRTELDAIFDRQKAFTENFHVFDLPLVEREQLTQKYALLLINELTEVINELNYKIHATQRKEVKIAKVHEELIDTQKYLLIIMLLWDIDAHEFVKLFHTKSAIVEQRYQSKER